MTDKRKEFVRLKYNYLTIVKAKWKKKLFEIRNKIFTFRENTVLHQKIGDN